MSNKYAYEEFEKIYIRQSTKILNLCRTYLGNEEDAKEAVQNIFIKLLEKHITFKDTNHETAWLCKTTRNHCLDVLKSSWHKKRVDMESVPETSATSNNQDNHENAILKKALNQLSIKQKEVIYLYYYEEYSIKEISKMLGRSQSTIQSQLAAGRKKLKELI